MFSLAFGPRYALAPRPPDRRPPRPRGPGSADLPPEVAILRCKNAAGDVELAMTTSAVTGFLSWLEAAPPGAAFYSDRD
nr:hypothetical protein GCM10025732_01070 [Glycomyces mayteni]